MSKMTVAEAAAAFEAGADLPGFEVAEQLSVADLLALEAFSRAAVEDTPSDAPGAYVIAGLVQGIAIGAALTTNCP